MPQRLGKAADRLSRSNSLKAQSTKFAMTAVIAAAVDGTLMWVLQLGLGVLGQDGSRAVGFVAGTLMAYLLNRRWTFNAQASKRRFVAVFATYAVTFAVNMLLYRRLFDLFNDHINATLALVCAFAIAQGSATLVNFYVQRWVIFRRTKKSFVLD